MSQSLACLLAHVVFSTKHRQRIIADDIRDELHGYIGGILRNLRGTLLHSGSVSDHIHLLVAHPRTSSPAELVEEIKTGSSAWIKTMGRRYANFHWQGGYGIFSISPSHRPALEKYLDNQREHHQQVTFQDEFRRLLRKYGIEFYERYVWDEVYGVSAIDQTHMAAFAPFDQKECEIRTLSGNIQYMQFSPRAYLGTQDCFDAETRAVKTEQTKSGGKRPVSSAPGAYFSSFEPALSQYLAICEGGNAASRQRSY